MASKFLRLPEVCKRVGLAKSTLYKLVTEGEFPPPIRPTQRTAAWVEEEIDAWQDQRIAASRTQGKAA